MAKPAKQGGEIFAPIADPLARFQEQCEANHTECILTSDSAASALIVAHVLASIPPGEIFLQDGPSLRRLSTGWTNGHEIRWSTEGPPQEATRASVTLAESLVGATGSVLVSASCGGRGASFLAPVHIVVATVSQLVPTLAKAFEWMSADGTATRNSMVTLITGPSRTGDIEKILVLGAHGPQRLIVVLAMKDE